MAPLMTTEQIVEVMRHAAGELADRFHLLGVSQLSFGFRECLFGALFAR